MAISLNSQFTITVKMILFLLIKNVICWKVVAGSFKLVPFPSFRSSRSALVILVVDLHKLLKLRLALYSPRAKRTGSKGLHAESARAVTGIRCPHSGKGEDFLTGQLNFFTETAVTPEQKVEKSFPRWEINRHAEG